MWTVNKNVYFVPENRCYVCAKTFKNDAALVYHRIHHNAKELEKLAGRKNADDLVELENMITEIAAVNNNHDLFNSSTIMKQIVSAHGPVSNTDSDIRSVEL